jgi:Family of unknown function (DUF5634) N-terminal domain/PilZ domain
MIIHPFAIGDYIRPGDHATVGIRLADHTFFEATVLIREVQGEEIELELVGEYPPAAAAETGAMAMLTKKDSLVLCRCHIVLTSALAGRILLCQVVDEVEVHQRREFFRLDVAIPIRCHVPDDQRLSAAIDYWSVSRISLEDEAPPRFAMTVKGGFRVLNWRGMSLEPQRLNLSGGGVRCKLSQLLPVGTLVNVEVFLPLTPGRIIHTVGIAVWSQELVLAENPQDSFLTAIRFVHLADNDRETIISYIFNEQRSQLRAYAEKR